MTKSTKEAQAAPGPESACPVSMFSNGLEQLAQLQKKTLEMVVQQNTQTLETCKKAMPQVPGAFLFDMVGETLQKCVAAQNSIVDLMVEQSVAMAKAVTTPCESMFKMPTAFLQQSVDRGVAVHKSALDVASQQNKAVSEAVKQQLANTPAAMAAESVQRGVETLIETQKNLLDIAAKPMKAAATNA